MSNIATAKHDDNHIHAHGHDFGLIEDEPNAVIDNVTDQGIDDVKLAPTSGINLEKVDGSKPCIVDENFAVLLILATAMCIFGCALLVAGLALPPVGVIDSSLLVAYGETLTFAGSLIGIDYHYRYKE